MIVIISSGIRDQSTDDVIDWLFSMKKKYLKISPSSILCDKKLEIVFPSILFKAKEKLITSGAVKKIWCRKWNVKSEIDYIVTKSSFFKTEYKLNELLISETNALFYYMTSILRSKKWYAHPKDIESNKLIQQIFAMEAGLNTPESSVTTDIHKLCNQPKKNQMITKLINSNYTITYNEKVYQSFTVLADSSLQNINFFPSLVQEYVEKQFEIRAFFIDGKIYSSAIFSQENTRTKLDFKRYDTKTPNRVVPYQLAKDIENKITKLMASLELVIGCIDLIMNKNEKIYFLEVNPFGEFGFHSKICNYNLEKKIAQNLAKK
jgi:ATP-GRASP peptide maturase of grasp-with-spasm system